MTSRVPRGLVLLALVVGCSSPAAAAPAVPDVASLPAPAPDTDHRAETVACHEGDRTAGTVRSIAAALQEGPLLPAGVARYLDDARTRATRAGIDDPGLVAAEAELLTAIDDLDAQGRALLPPGGDPARLRVQLDASRLVAAVERVRQACGPFPIGGAR